MITVKNLHKTNGCRSILLPLDLTEETRQKVRHAIEMAKLFGSTIKVVSVHASGGKITLNKLQHQIKQVTAFIEKAKVECTAEIIERKTSMKNLAPIILEYAKTQKDIDLLIIMTQHEAGLFDLFMSSYAQYFLTHSEVPVMSIIPRQLGFSSMIN